MPVKKLKLIPGKGPVKEKKPAGKRKKTVTKKPVVAAPVPSVDLSKIKLPTYEEVMVELDRRRCKTSLAEFVKASWHIIEPATPLVWGQVLDVMCRELESIYFNPGFQPRLLMNVPPGTMKSILVSVMFPAWVWTLNPSKSFTGAAHEQGLAIRDARKMRIIVESDWYQARWPLKLTIDANAKTFFENEKRGFRQAMPFRSLTGRRSDYVLIDDPLSAEDANSEAHITESERIFRETLPTRINNDQSAIIVIMQRLAQADTSGLILDHPKKYGYKTLILPMRFEKDRADPKDWRTVDGELLFPERYSLRAVEALEEILGAYGTAGQFQQRPSPRDGGLFNRAWFKMIDAMPNDLTLCRGYDLAATTNQTSAYTVGVLMGMSRDGKIVICDVVRGRWSPDSVYNVILQSATSDGTHTRISCPLDPGQAGVAQKNHISKLLSGYDIRFSPESGDKITRALPLSAQCESGNVYLLKGDWNKDFLDEICMFPGSKFKDQVDACSRAYSELLKMTKNLGGGVSCFGPVII